MSMVEIESRSIFRRRRAELRRLILVLAIGLPGNACTPAASTIDAVEGRSQVSWEDADEFIGQMVSVVGRVERVGHATRIHFLNFHESRRDAFTIVIYQEHLELFPGSLEELYLHKIVRVQGQVTQYRDTPQIRVTSPTQIEVLAVWPDLTKPPSPAKVASDRFRVGTFNVENLFDDLDDPYAADETTPAKPREDLARLAQTIRQLDADILALQEVESRGYLEQFTHTFLADAGYREVIHYEGNDQRGIDVAMLSRFPIESVTSYRHAAFEDEQGRNQRFRRDLLRVTVQPPRGESFEVWCIHLKSSGDDARTSEPIRSAEAQKIRALYDQTIDAKPGARILLLGDFNDTLESRSLRILLGSERLSLQTLLQDLPFEQRVTYNQGPHRSMIDFILASPAMADTYVGDSYRIYHGDPETHGSDHNPVVADFWFRNDE